MDLQHSAERGFFSLCDCGRSELSYLPCPALEKSIIAHIVSLEEFKLQSKAFVSIVFIKSENWKFNQQVK